MSKTLIIKSGVAVLIIAVGYLYILDQFDRQRIAQLWNPAPFDSQKWKKKGVDSRYRFGMVHSLIRDQVLSDKTRQHVLELLGPPDYWSIDKDGRKTAMGYSFRRPGGVGSIYINFTGDMVNVWGYNNGYDDPLDDF